VSTFMGVACADLRPGADVRPFVEAVVRGNRSPAVWAVEHDGRPRLGFLAQWGNAWLAGALADAGRETGVLERAIIALDHDEYGAEHLIVSGADGVLSRVQHVYIYPGGEPDGEFQPLATGCPPHPDAGADADGLIDGPAAWSLVADLYEVPLARVEKAARDGAYAYQQLGSVLAPFEPWWNAVAVHFPLGFGEPDPVLSNLPAT
jgi:hypothetical protein